jgi:hypothetical protein
MKNLVKLSIFAIALGFFASCSDSKETPAAETPAVETPAPTPAPAADTMAPAATTEAPAADTTKK